jgi:O-succinylbenzoic acid--CoA ligase
MSAPDGLSVERAAELAPDATALVDEERSWSYRELAERVRSGVDRLECSPAGERTSTREIVCFPDGNTVIELIVAIESARPAILIHPRWTQPERERASRRASSALEQLRSARFAQDGRPTLAVGFTSGTTGRPRAVVLSRESFIASANASASRLGWRPQDRWLLCLSPAHVGGLSIVTRCLLARRAIVTLPRFEPAAFAERIDNENVTLVSLVPAMLARLLEELPRWKPPEALRAVLLGGASAPDSLLAEARRRGLPVLPTYGLTEACSQVATEPPGSPSGTGRGCGPPLPGLELRLDDGEILVRGPVTATAMLDDDLLEPACDEEGWLRTGDLGRIDEQGWLHVLGRLSERIITGGENVSPLEVERELERIPGIAAALVFPISDPLYGERVAAAMVPAGPAPPDDSGIVAHLEASLASFKRPRAIAWVERLPLTASGKPDRAGARRMLAARLRELG